MADLAWNGQECFRGLQHHIQWKPHSPGKLRIFQKSFINENVSKLVYQSHYSKSNFTLMRLSLQSYLTSCNDI